jgi:DNA adenine methylase
MERGFEPWERHYYATRALYNAGPFGGALHTAYFLWLNRTCFNGLYRENRKGEFNAPVGSYKKPSFPTPEHLREVSALLQGVQIEAADFRGMMAAAGPDDQVYCDPPFVPLSATANFTAYSAGGFGAAEQTALASMARWAAMRGASVLLSNHDLPLVRSDLYPPSQGFEVVCSYRSARSISRKAESRAGVDEALFRINPDTIRAAQEKKP